MINEELTLQGSNDAIVEVASDKQYFAPVLFD